MRLVERCISAFFMGKGVSTRLTINSDGCSSFYRHRFFEIQLTLPFCQL